MFVAVCPGITAAWVVIAATAMAAGPKQIGAPISYPIYIKKTGSYVLTANLSVPNGATGGIVIEATGVTIDFSGFSLASQTGGTPVGITSTTGVDDTTIKNGFVAGFGSDGILLGDDSTVVKMNVFGNGKDGIHTGSGSLVTGCLSHHNGGFGISFGDNTSGYSNDVIYNNGGGTVQNGTPAGVNVCDGSSTCP